MTPARWTWARVVGGAAVLGVLLWRLGTGPFLDGLRTVDAWSLAVAALIAVPTTVCCALRWRTVARGLGVGLPLGDAVASYYRSQFLNTTLPGGVVGDVHRAVRHGRSVGDTGRGLRAVAWERVAGQVVLFAIAGTVLLLLPSPVSAAMPVVVVAAAATGLVALLVVRLRPLGGGTRWLRAVRSDVRDGLLAPRALPVVAVTSMVAVVGHVATFLVAARTAGVTASPGVVVPLALLVLLAMGIPANVAGWGPREGVAAWAFAAAGLGADQGVATAVVYGVMAFVASLPGAVVLVVAWRMHRTPPRQPRRRDEVAAATAGPVGARHG